jgi:hypothetical protein
MALHLHFILKICAELFGSLEFKLSAQPSFKNLSEFGLIFLFTQDPQGRAIQKLNIPMLHSSKAWHYEHPLKLSFKNVFCVHKYAIKLYMNTVCQPVCNVYSITSLKICCTVSELFQLGPAWVEYKLK